MEYNFKGKQAIVTGAGRGIGRAIAIELALKGASVIAVSQTKQNLESLKKEVPKIETVQLDISNWSQTETVIKSIGPVHLLVNNAGVVSLQEVGSITEDEFDRCIAVNLKAPANITQIVANGMKSAGIRGSIVNISSQAALGAIARHPSYCASKAGLDHLAKVCALELGPFGIRVNSINPTVVLTDMGKEAWGEEKISAAMKARIPLGEFCVPEDIVKATFFLLSDESRMITGVQLPVDGGLMVQ